VSENGYDNSRAVCTVCRVPLRESARWGQKSKYAFDAGPTCRPVSKSQTFRAALSPVKPSRRPPAAVTSRSEAIVVLHYCQEPTFVLGQRLSLVSIQVGLQSCCSAIAPILAAASFASMPTFNQCLILANCSPRLYFTRTLPCLVYAGVCCCSCLGDVDIARSCVVVHHLSARLDHAIRPCNQRNMLICAVRWQH